MADVTIVGGGGGCGCCSGGGHSSGDSCGHIEGGQIAGTFDFAKDGRSAHEHHGKGHICYANGAGHNHPIGGVHFNDSTPSGKHSHTVYDLTKDGTTSHPTVTRSEGHNQEFTRFGER